MVFTGYQIKLLYSSIGGQNDVSGMSTYRSDLEIHAPDSKILPKRPQSTTELVSVEKVGLCPNKNQMCMLRSLKTVNQKTNHLFQICNLKVIHFKPKSINPNIIS